MQRRGNCLGRTVAAMKPEAQPHPRQDSQQTKDAGGRPVPNGAMANSACGQNDGFTGLHPWRGQGYARKRQARTPLESFRGGVIGGYDIGAAWKLHSEAVRRVVNRPS